MLVNVFQKHLNKVLQLDHCACNEHLMVLDVGTASLEVSG